MKQPQSYFKWMTNVKPHPFTWWWDWQTLSRRTRSWLRNWKLHKTASTRSEQRLLNSKRSCIHSPIQVKSASWKMVVLLCFTVSLGHINRPPWLRMIQERLPSPKYHENAHGRRSWAFIWRLVASFTASRPFAQMCNTWVEPAWWRKFNNTVKYCIFAFLDAYCL